ncbi:MAG: biosynthetic arginine decarboxylase [Limnothrix sp. RL_2_0]|nr:biosynthetic arginine decarboxylase [Limnothrix sp. RL_2_0]
MDDSLRAWHSSMDQPWTGADSRELYRIAGWGEPYFDINAEGHVQVTPMGKETAGVDLFKLVQRLDGEGIKPPLLLRFPDILGDRLHRLQDCFDQAIARYGYGNEYRGVYPVKCNQYRHVVADVVRLGQPYNFGLEAGSKPELMLAIAMLDPSVAPKSLLICNGYKDENYIELALLATQLGHRAIIVVEQPEELAFTLAVSEKMNVPPLIGLRAKLSSQGIGRWGSSSGDRAKFGLTVPQILQAVDSLKQAKMIDCLQLLHYHIGSQLSAISVVKAAIREASQIYAELVLLGANMQFLDVGGGLAVDYNGSKNNSPASKNYNMQNYANDVVATVKDTCDEKNIPAPILVSESGRAIASHQTVLIFNILQSHKINSAPPTQTQQTEPLALRNLRETYNTITPENCQEAYHDAVQFKEEAISLFNLGYLSLGDRACAEELYWSCCQKISTIIQSQPSTPEDLTELQQNMATTYYANLSIFQSIPDSWAIHQLFPVMPIHRLNEQPLNKGTIVDLTCDSDGRINHFIDQQNNQKKLLELHEVQGKPYYLGLFLMGAYQETMGNFHNLFGRIPVVDVTITKEGYTLEKVLPNQTIQNVLSKVQYSPDELLKGLQKTTFKAIKNDCLTKEKAAHLIQTYQTSFSNSTYLD